MLTRHSVEHCRACQCSASRATTIAMGWRSQLSTSLKEGLKPVVDLVYPPRCPLCGDSIGDQAGLCMTCWSDLETPGEPSCTTCGLPVMAESDREDLRCADCVVNQPGHSGIVAATIYNDASRQLVLAFKHGRKISLAGMLARLIAARLPAADEGDSPLLVPVPLHPLRLWQRGFNQSALIARELSKRGKGELVVDALVRRKHTPSLGGIGAGARKRVLSGAIESNPKRAAQLIGRDIILVDDVLTSGATSDACVSVLKKTGANRVMIACFARVIDGRLSATPLLNNTKDMSQKNTTPEVIKTPGAT